MLSSDLNSFISVVAAPFCDSSTQHETNCDWIYIVYIDRYIAIGIGTAIVRVGVRA